MVFAVLTIEVDGHLDYSAFPRRFRLHRDYGFIPWRVERLDVVIFQFDLQNLIEMQDGFVCVAHLEILVDHPCDLPSRENAFFSFLCSFILNEDSSFEVSVDDILESTRDLRVKNLEVCLQLGPSGRIRRLQFDKRLRGLHLADPYHCFNRTTCTRRYFAPDIHLPDPEVSEISTGFEVKFFSFPLLGSCVSPLVLAPPHAVL